MSPEFTQRIGTVDIALSVFEDAHGFWAKEWCEVTRVRVAFADGVVTFLTPAEFHSLSGCQKVLVFSAPSTPRPAPVTP